MMPQAAAVKMKEIAQREAKSVWTEHQRIIRFARGSRSGRDFPSLHQVVSDCSRVSHSPGYADYSESLRWLVMQDSLKDSARQTGFP